MWRSWIVAETELWIIHATRKNFLTLSEQRVKNEKPLREDLCPLVTIQPPLHPGGVNGSKPFELGDPRPRPRPWGEGTSTGDRERLRPLPVLCVLMVKISSAASAAWSRQAVPKAATAPPPRRRQWPPAPCCGCHRYRSDRSYGRSGPRTNLLRADGARTDCAWTWSR